MNDPIGLRQVKDRHHHCRQRHRRDQQRKFLPQMHLS
jgi:hypothetical protein